MVRLTDEADADLEAIADYVAERNPSAGVSLIRGLRRRFAQLAAMPRLGQRRPDLGPGLRALTYSNYVIIYRVGEDTVIVARVLHGARDMQSALRDDD